MSGNFDSFPPSGPKETFRPEDNFHGEPRPEHHIHRDSEPLSASNATSYGQHQSQDPGVREHTRDLGAPSLPPLFFFPYSLLLGVTGVDQVAPDFQDTSFKQNAFNSDRPLNVQPVDQGGVAIDGRGGLPEGRPDMADKIIGKMQKVIYRHLRPYAPCRI